jgi:hypothetical protein
VATAPEKIEGVYHDEAFYTERWKADKSKVGHLEQLTFRQKRDRVDPFLQ